MLIKKVLSSSGKSLPLFLFANCPPFLSASGLYRNGPNWKRILLWALISSRQIRLAGNEYNSFLAVTCIIICRSLMLKIPFLEYPCFFYKSASRHNYLCSSHVVGLGKHGHVVRKKSGIYVFLLPSFCHHKNKPISIIVNPLFRKSRVKFHFKKSNRETD